MLLFRRLARSSTSRMAMAAASPGTVSPRVNNFAQVRHHSNEDHLSEADQDLQNKIKSAHREMTAQVSLGT